MVKLDQRRDCCEEILGSVKWNGDEGTLEECPGEHLHTTSSKLGDCKVYLSHVPTVFCFHTSCEAVRTEKSKELRREIGGLYREEGQKVPWLTGCRKTVKEYSADEKERVRLDDEARRSLPEILRSHSWDPRDAYKESASRVIKGREWQQHLSLFDPFDLVWIGDLYNTGAGHGHHFRLARDWMKLAEQPYGRFICPSTFNKELKRGFVIHKTTHRRNVDVDERRLLLLESDTLSRTDSCAIYNWCRDFMKLRALVLSGNKSIHAWFDFPPKPTFQALKAVLPALQIDPKFLTTPSQPGRFAHAVRENGNRQHSIWFDQPNSTWRDLAPFLFP